MNQSNKNMKKSIIQDQKVDDNHQRKKNEENLKIPLNLYRSYTRITQQSLLEEIAPMMSQIEFLKKNCPEGTKIEEFVSQACSYFKYEQFSKGQIVFNYGEYGDKVYLILLGEVGVFISRSQEEIANDREVIETYKSNMNPFEEEVLDYENLFKKKKRAQDLQMELLLQSFQRIFIQISQIINNLFYSLNIQIIQVQHHKRTHLKSIICISKMEYVFIKKSFNFTQVKPLVIWHYNKIYLFLYFIF